MRIELDVLRGLAATALVALAGCSDEPPRRPPEREQPTVSASPVPPGAELPAAQARPRYVGRWASRADLCEGGAWVFERDRFGMEDGPMCGFDRVSEIPEGYRIVAQCEGTRGERSRSTATTRFADGDRTMSVSGLSSLPETELVYCGPV